jgi:hypothetical protein
MREGVGAAEFLTILVRGRLEGWRLRHDVRRWLVVWASIIVTGR